MSTIDDIKSRLDIVEIISESVPLRKSGRSYLGFCPFHPNTRTPAFTVYPDTQSFYCFGCHAAGTVFDFVMRKQGLDFRDALQQLANRAGIQLIPRSAEEQQLDQHRTRLLEITSLAARYFNYLLLSHTRGQPGRDYLTRRAIQPETVEWFQLGYSLNEQSHLLAYLTDRKGFAPEEVEAAGLAIHHEQRGWYDRFRGRLIFPIRNARGEVVGFGGRALGDAHPKYLNTPQTVLFDKSHVLYGLDLARDAIRAADATVIVEGYIDVITAHQHGFRNVVAPLGTALTSSHVAMIKKLSHNVYLALDADAAGQKATLRGLHAFEHTEEGDEARPTVTPHGLVHWQRDINLRIIKMPEGRDPDEVIKSDPQLWHTLLAAALPVIDFYIEAYTADLNLASAQDQRTALDRLLPLIRQLDSTQQRIYVARLEQVVRIRAELILDLLRQAPTAPKSSPGTRPRDLPSPPDTHSSGPTPRDRSSPALRSPLNRREDYLLTLLLHHPTLVASLETMLASDLQPFPQVQNLLGSTLDRLFEQTENRVILKAWLDADQPELPDPSETGETTAILPASPQEHKPAWVQHLDETLHPQLEQVLTLPLPSQHIYRYRQDAENCVRHLRLAQARRWQRRLSQQLQEIALDDTEHTRIQDLLNELQSYVALINAPPRKSSWTDVRDSLRRPYEE